jgi:two-component system, NarL family, nitrate/nitrite response regulator NarL
MEQEMNTTVVVADHNNLFREGFQRQLQERGYVVGDAGPSLCDVVAGCCSSLACLDLLIWDPASDEPQEREGLLREVRSCWPRAKIVVFTDRKSTALATLDIASMIDGWLLKDISPTACWQSLQSITRGEHILPSWLMAQLVRRSREDQANYDLTERQIRILALIVCGRSNKGIAAHLGISEATVNGDVRALLRTTRARNRTQAAMWALERGVSQPDALAAEA